MHHVADIKLLVLDLVGTMVADDGQVDRAFEKALGTYGLMLPPAQLAEVRGLRKRDAIEQLIAGASGAEANPAEVYANFREEMKAEYGRRPARLLPGVAQLLSWLAMQPLRSAVNTGLDRDLAGMLLEAVPHAFHAVVTGDEVAAARPAPFLVFRAMEMTGTTSVHHVAVAGDTAADLRAGWNAGARVNVGVLSGAHSRERLEREPHTHLIESLAELPAILENTTT
jgi:phosphonatase-like hydrolase